MRNFKEVEVGNFWAAKKTGDTIEGEILTNDKIINTTFGEMGYVELLHEETGEIVKVGISGGLKMALDMVDIGKYIQIKYTGEQVNPKTKRTYKAYKVAVAE